jgi:hypothetical protein
MAPSGVEEYSPSGAWPEPIIDVVAGQARTTGRVQKDSEPLGSLVAALLA